MLKQTIASATLIAMSNLMLSGCAQYTTMSLTDVLNSNHKLISEVTTIEGERIVYDSTGAKYLEDSKSIVGLSQDGSRVHRFTCDLDEVTLVDPTREDTLPLVLPAAQLSPHFSQKRFDRIISLVTKGGELLRFTSAGASIDRPGRTLTGKPMANLQSGGHRLMQSSDTTGVKSSHACSPNYTSDSTVAVPFGKVDYVTVERARDTRTLKGLLLVASIGAILYIFSTTSYLNDDDWDDWKWE